jgi:hypothetical protein
MAVLIDEATKMRGGHQWPLFTALATSLTLTLVLLLPLLVRVDVRIAVWRVEFGTHRTLPPTVLEGQEFPLQGLQFSTEYPFTAYRFGGPPEGSPSRIEGSVRFRGWYYWLILSRP